MSESTPEQNEPQQVIVVGPDGAPTAIPVLPPGDDEVEGPGTVANLVNQPAKVMRIGSMVKQLLEEVRSAPLDEAGRKRLREVHERSIKELEAGLAPELIEELERISLPFSDESVPSEAELRIAQAQLVGWLEGLFHGIQTALFAQQMAAQAQLDEMRRHAALEAAPAPGDGVRPGQSGPYL
jgi:hypothetical protein